MRTLAPLVALVVAAGAAFLVYLALTASTRRRTHYRTHRQRARARWQTRHYGERGETVVAVSLMLPSGEVLDEHVVVRIPDSDPDWNGRFLRAREEAEERAFHLNGTLPDL
jgi:pyridoxamine 5'-phosphate oxidase family protein